MKTRLNRRTKEQMGLYYVDGVLTDKYGRTFETYIDDQGYEDIKPNGVQRNMSKYYEIASKSK